MQNEELHLQGKIEGHSGDTANGRLKKDMKRDENQ